MAITYHLLGSTTLSVDTSILSVGSIPATYDDLIVRFTAHSTAAGNGDQFYIAYNNATASKVAGSMEFGSYGSGLLLAAANSSTLNTTTFSDLYIMSGANTYVSGFELIMANYTAADGVRKPIYANGGGSNSTNNYSYLLCSNWAGAPLSEIRIYALTGNIKANSSMQVYGVKYA